MFTAGGLGFLASGPPGYTGKPPFPAEIQRTRDRGRSWATVWRRTGYRLTWIGTAGGTVVAAGLSADGLRPFLLVGNGAGTSWHLVHMSISAAAVPTGVQAGMAASAVAQIWGSYQFHFVDQSLGFGAPDPMVGDGTVFPGELLRTTDGGRHWTKVELPGGTPTGGLAFVSDQQGFATGMVSANRRSVHCPLDQIWTTSDGGSRWQSVAGTCSAYQLTSLAFPSASTGFAAGGQYLKYSGYGEELVMLKTTDGGRRWGRAYYASVPGPAALDINPFGEVAFFNPSDGLALDGGQTMGGNAPVGGHLWRTTDGGRSWSELGVKGLRLVLDGRGGAWVVGGQFGDGGDVLWRSVDRGRTWAPLGNPGRVTVNAVAGYGDQMWVSTEAGGFLSDDGGRSWHLPPAAMQAALGGAGPDVPVEMAAGGTVVIGPGWTGGDGYWLSGDGGRSGTLRRLGALDVTGIAAIAFRGPRQGLAIGGGGSCSQPAPVLATSDGGARWYRVGSLAIGVGNLAYDSVLAVVTGWGCDSNAVAISTSSGKAWSVVTTGNPCGTVSAYARTVVMSCANLMPGGQYLLLSRDGGGHWATC